MVIIPDFYFEALEEAHRQFIADCHEDNGILRKYIENCDDDYRRQFAEHLVRVNDIVIENIMGEIEDDRRRAEEFGKLPGGRQSNLLPGNEDNARNAQTVSR
jgi:hypothetical protein